MRRIVEIGGVFPIDEIVAHLEGGGLLGYPTETVYGLGAAPDAAGVEGVRTLKGRESDRPFLLLLPAGPEGEIEVERWGLRLSTEGAELAAAFWPGPLTMVLSDPEHRFPPGIRSPSGGVAVRISAHPFVEALMARWDRPLISTSANRSGAPPARDADRVEAMAVGAEGAERLWIVGGPPLLSTVPSTLVDLTATPPRLLRAGSIPEEALKRILPELDDGGR